MVVFKMYSRFFVVLKCTVQGGAKIDVLLIAFLQLGYGSNFETVGYSILTDTVGRSVNKIILLSSLIINICFWLLEACTKCSYFI